MAEDSRVNTAGGDSSTGKVHIRIGLVEDEDLSEAQSTAEESPKVSIDEYIRREVPEGEIEGAIEPITAILIGAGVLAAAQFVMTWWERRRGGLIIDQRPNAENQVYRDAGVEYGYVIIFPRDDDGAVRVETKNSPKDPVQQLLEAVLGGVIESINGIAEKASDLIGAEKVKVEA